MVTTTIDNHHSEVVYQVAEEVTNKKLLAEALMKVKASIRNCWIRFVKSCYVKKAKMEVVVVLHSLALSMELHNLSMVHHNNPLESLELFWRIPSQQSKSLNIAHNPNLPADTRQDRQILEEVHHKLALQAQIMEHQHQAPVTELLLAHQAVTVLHFRLMVCHIIA